MKLADFYDDQASTQWFSERYRKLSVHESLLQKHFQVISEESLHNSMAEVEVPVSMVNMSWGDPMCCPKVPRSNTYIARQMYDLTKNTYKSQSLSTILTNWMDEYLSGTKYLVSLNPAHYLVTTTDSIEFDDVFTVSSAWSIDCVLGVFDETASVVFIFDAEFWVTTVSFASTPVSDEVEAFSKQYNAEFNEIFIRDNHLLSHADPERAQEYFDKVISPFI